MSTKVAIVTGSSRGIGKAVAARLAEVGYALVVNGTQPSDELEATADAVRDAGQPVAIVPADIGDLDTHATLLTAAQELGELHCLVNNAGVSVLSRGDLLDASPASYDQCMQVNARGSFFLSQSTAKLMLATQPQVPGHRCMIFVTSVNAVAATVERGEYCMSKSAASMAARLYGLRLAQAGIGSYEIQAGLIRTDMSAPSQDKYDQLIAEGWLPIPRWGEPADVARVVTTMAAGDLEYTVGQAVQLDGGLITPRL